MIREGLWAKLETLFGNFGWDVVILRHGSLQEAAFGEPGGHRLKAWIEACPNQLYSALTFQGRRGLAGAAARRDRRPGRQHPSDRAPQRRRARAA